MRLVTQFPLARRDIKENWKYSRRKWGKAQANSYTLNIGRMIGSLAEMPYKGVSIDYIREGYRKRIVGKHFIIYRVTDTHIDVVCVLKQDMDIPQHLN